MTSAGLSVLNCCAPPTTVEALQVRAARKEDLPAALALIAEAELPTDGVADQFEGGYAVIERKGRVFGVAGLEVYGDAGLLRSVAVAKSHRDMGLGALLVHDRLQAAREQQIRAVYLLTTTAARFFERFGFEQIDRSAADAQVQRAPEFTTICGSESATMRVSIADGADIRAVVREKYAAAARASSEGAGCACCGDSKTQAWDPVTSNLYEAGQTDGIPAEALLASLGCGNPTALAQLHEGEIVLDLGSGGGIDVLLSAKRVGPTGKAYGLDMTDEMLALARANQAKAGATNVEFLKGEIENIPLPDNSVDVIISNCVINLSADKRQVLREAWRVLKPGGRFAVSDIVVRGDMPALIRRNAELWTGCIAGALEEKEYVQLLRAAGFVEAAVEPTRVYSLEDAIALATDAGLVLQKEAVAQLAGKFMSAFVRARKA